MWGSAAPGVAPGGADDGTPICGGLVRFGDRPSRVGGGVMGGMDVKIDQAVCGECGHPPLTKPRRSTGLRQLLGLKIPSARCTVGVFDASGWGSMPCDCQDPCHGS